MAEPELPSLPPGRSRSTADRVRGALTLAGVILVVAAAVFLIVGGVSGVADFLHVSERDVVPISIGVVVAAWLLWRAVNLSRRPD